MPRSMTSAEKTVFRRIFPRLNVDAAIVTGERTAVYNCIAWTIGDTRNWHWPGRTLAEFDQFYSRYNLFRSPSGHIAAWGATERDMRHGSIVAPAPLALWESKCGEELRIQHAMNELESPDYGRILAFYGRGRAANARPEGKFMMPKLGAAERKVIDQDAAGLDEELRRIFDELFARWRAEWQLPHIAIASDPAVRRLAPSFYSLLELGPDILPLVVREMAKPSQFFALQLYEVLQGDPTLQVTFAPDSDDAAAGEQGRAVATVRRYLSARER